MNKREFSRLRLGHYVQEPRTRGQWRLSGHPCRVVGLTSTGGVRIEDERTGLRLWHPYQRVQMHRAE